MAPGNAIGRKLCPRSHGQVCLQSLRYGEPESCWVGDLRRLRGKADSWVFLGLNSQGNHARNRRPPSHSGQQRFSEEGVVPLRLQWCERGWPWRAGFRQEILLGSGLPLKGGSALIPEASRGRSGLS